MPDVTDTQPNSVPNLKRKFPGWIAALGFLVLIALGIFGGYQSGLGQRLAAKATVDAQQLGEQFQLGMEAMDDGQYEIALQHFNYVIQNAPSYPGLQDAYTKLLVLMSVSPTPTFTLTPTLTPTPDLRGAEAIYNQVKQYMAAQDWDNVIANLDSLRKADPTFHTVEVDGMYYIALRNRGMAKIQAASCQDINLEGGIYDLTLAERFGPLDSNADGVRNFARYYITGAAFWEVDWLQAQYYFSQTMLGYPNLMDASCETATERWRFATIEYARKLLNDGKFCDAQLQFEAAFSVPGTDADPNIYITATAAYLQCYPPTSTRLPVTRTPTPSDATPTETLPVGETPTSTP